LELVFPEAQMEGQTVSEVVLQDFGEVEASEVFVHPDGMIAADDFQEENLLAVSVNILRLDSGIHDLGDL
jgi:hypothetical protein